MARDFPECMAASAYLRGIADQLAGFAGGTIGAAIGARRGKPMEGSLIGRTLAPRIIETGALAIADKIKKKRSRKQKGRDKRMSNAMSKAISKAKLKNGSWRKGWNQSRLMKEAHRLCK